MNYAISVDKKRFLILLCKVLCSKLFKPPPGFSFVGKLNKISIVFFCVALNARSGNVKKFPVFLPCRHRHNASGSIRLRPAMPPKRVRLIQGNDRIVQVRLGIHCVMPLDAPAEKRIR